MLEINPELYEKILDTPGFSFHFNQICLLAKAADEDPGSDEIAEGMKPGLLKSVFFVKKDYERAHRLSVIAKANRSAKAWAELGHDFDITLEIIGQPGRTPIPPK